MKEVTVFPAELCDEQLILQVRSNQEDGAYALSVLIARYTVAVKQTALHYSNSANDTDDLIQEGFLGLLSAIRTFRSDKSTCFRTYAAVCIRNRMISHLRQQASVSSLVQQDVPEQEQPQADPILHIIDRETATALQHQLKQLLSPFEYQVLLMHLSSYSYRETAKQLQTTTKAVDNAWQRIRRKCTQLLA